jgi:uncharacterized protein (TIGR02646 family)
MINLIKLDKPGALVRNGLRWTKEIMSFYNQGLPIPDSVINKYSHNEVKEKLIEETNEKCAYCESYITDVSFGDIEHIVPKSLYPRLAVSWSNLTLACNKCNNAKGDYIEKPTLLINPYRDNIAQHLIAIGEIIMHVTGSDKGRFTRKKLKLNRKKLKENRYEAIEAFQMVLDQYHKENISSFKELYREQLEEMMGPDKEYSFTLKCYAIAQNFI